MNFELSPEVGRTFSLDLQEGSLMYSPIFPDQGEKLPVAPFAYGYFRAGPGHFTRRESRLALYQLFVTHSGYGQMILGDRTFRMGPGTAALLNLNQPHCYRTDGSHWEHEWVNFGTAGCGAYERLINPEGFSVYSLAGNQAIFSLMLEIRTLAPRRDTLSLTQAGTRIFCLLDALAELANRQRSGIAPGVQQNLQRAIRLMEEHYAEKLSLDLLAQAAFLSKYHFDRAFRRSTGLSPHEYLAAIRLSHAKSLLATTLLSAEEISWRTGFGPSKNMIRHFQQAMGITPIAYRREKRFWSSDFIPTQQEKPSACSD